MSDQQSFEHHARFVPAYHFVTFGLLGLNFGWATYSVFKSFSVGALIAFLTAIALVSLFLFARIFPIGVQDRLIRLEERMRLHRLLPDDQQSRANDLTTQQLIALRFACDEELPQLAIKVLDENIVDQKDVKKLIKTWRPDPQRI